MLMFANLFSPVVAGLYALTERVLSLPMQVLGGAINDVFFSNASEAHRSDSLSRLVVSVHEKLAHIAMPPMAIIIVIGPELFGLVFGDSWSQAGQFGRWLAPWIYLCFVTSPLNPLFSILEIQKQTTIYQAILLLTRVSTIWYGSTLEDLSLTFILFSAGSCICGVIWLTWIMKISGNSRRALIKPTASALLISTGLVLPILVAQHLNASLPYILVGLGCTVLLTGARYVVLFRKFY